MADFEYYRDLKNSLDTARDEGKIEGIIEVARQALKKGMSVRDISDITGLSEADIEKLK